VLHSDQRQPPNVCHSCIQTRNEGNVNSEIIKRAKAIVVVGALVSMAIVPVLLTASQSPATAQSPVNDDWPTSLHDVERTSSSNDTNISPSAAPTLTKLWSYQAGGIVASQVTVSGGTAYFGSWDGYENAVNATTGALEWQTYLGVTTAPPSDNCFPSTAGVDSAASIVNGVDYVGGGDNYWYALNASTGAVLWRVLVGSPTGVYDGHYNWSSPLIVNGYAYVGVASFGDCPLIQGQLIQVNLSTGTIQNTANLVPNGQIGAGIWTSPAYDPATNTIYTATGTKTTPSQPYGQAVLAINATTLEVTDSWELPETEAIFDSDFGTSTTLFTDSNGDQLLGVINKNGYMYAFNRNSLSSGPIWQRQIAIPGDCPTCGDSSVSSAAAFGSNTLYIAGGQGFINGVGYPGTIDALNPATGVIEWQHPCPGTVIGALTYDNGMLIDAAGSVLEILSAATGQRLYSYDTGSDMWAAPSIADGIIYTGNNAGTVTAFALPATPPPPPPPDPNCPTNFTCQDIGSPTPAGSETVTNGAWAIDAGGTGVGGTSDSFRLASETNSGDTQVTAEVTQVPTTAGSQAGLMIRQRNDPDSPYYAVLAEPNNTLAVEYRGQFGGQTQVATTTTDPGLPLYLMIQRVGDNFQAATSTDGVNYTLVTGSNATLPMPTAVLAGLAVASGANGTTGTALMSAVTIGSPGSAPSPPAPATACPSGWSCQDVGNPLLVGNQSLSGGTWTLTGAGNGIDQEQPTDQFHYVWQTMAGDATVSAQVLTQTVTDPYAAAGPMMRASTAGNAEYYGAFLTPDSGIEVQYRDTTGVTSIQATTQTAETPQYIEIARSGTTFTTYTSTDGTTWTPIDVSTVTLPNLSGSILAGLAVSSNTPNTLGTATFGSVTVAPSAPAPPGICPTTWNCEDIGLPALAGNQNDNGGTWTVQASGGDIWDTVDQFRFVSQSFSGNGSISAQVQSQSFTDPWAKSGVMVRLSDNATDPYYGVFVTPQNGIVVQYRTQANAFTSQYPVSGTTPTYLKIEVSGYTYSAYTSTDGVNWSMVPNSSVTIPALTGVLQAGLVVCAHNSQELNTTVFNNVSINSSGIVGLPSPWADGDVGGATPSGSASFSDNVYTVNGGGNDLGTTANDQFNYVSQSFSGDGTIIAQVTSQTDTDPWAKSGVMIKQSTTSGAPYAFIGITPGNGVAFQYGNDVSVSGGSYTSPNIWVKLARQGSVITGYSSNDGVNWTQVGQAVIAMTDPVTVGLAVTSHNPNVLNTSTFTDVSVNPVGDGPLPAPWTSQDVGSPGLPGSGLYSPYNGTFTVNGSGAAIGGASDQFQYVDQPLNGDGTITARVVTQDQTDPWAESGIMIRQSAASGAPYVLLATTPGNGIVFQGTGNTTVSAGNFAYPEWLSLERIGNNFVALVSPDGVNWTQVGSMAVPMNTQATTGLVVNSHNNALLNTTTFDSVSVNAGSFPVPSPWTDQDIGGPGVPGSAAYNDGTFTVSGSGNDIWQTLDQFNYVSEPFTGDDETITARVTSQSDTNPWAKSGIIIKQSDQPGSPYVLLAVTPGNGIAFQYNYDTTISGGDYTFPNAWLRLQLAGGIVTAYDSPDGVNWTEVGSVALNLSGNATVGLTVCSHNNGVINTSTFDNVALSPSPVIISAASTTFGLNSPYSFMVSASGNAPVSYSESGALPTGVSLSTSGVLAGTPATGTARNYPFNITATDGDGNTVSQAFVLTVTASTTVTSVSPTSGSTAGGTSVTITGANFTGATAVDFGTVPASTFTVNSGGSITATAPAKAAGTVDVTVKTPGGTSARGAADKFTFVAPPKVTKISPKSGTTAGGTSVTITGANFTGATAVDFGSIPASAFAVESKTSITATAPAEAAGSVDVTVINGGLTSGTSSADKFTFVALPPPKVTKVSPKSGSTAGGTKVTITGANFTGASAVDFGSVSASTFAVKSKTSITATAPGEAAGSVDVTVINGGVTSATSSADKFTFVAP
jgi:regulation of enolase protein 1 (concanavalin A-like superfamily)